MPDQKQAAPVLVPHGAATLTSVVVDNYNLEIRDETGFVGDRASKSAFRAILDTWREPLRKLGADPLGDETSSTISKKELDALLSDGDPEAAGLVHSAVEDFARELAHVIKRFLKAQAWRGTEAIVIGGGLRASRVGELAIGRAGVLLKSQDIDVQLELIKNHPDEAGLIGAAHLMPAWSLQGFDAILAVDIGGTNIRAGVVEMNLGKAPDLAKAKVWESELWRHADDQPTRNEAVAGVVDMLQDLIAKCGKAKLQLAPVIGIACPGIIAEDGSIETGAQNLPGNWVSPSFNLPERLRASVSTIGKHETMIVMHNDAVVQGLSEVPRMRDVTRWGVLTIGTGLGNARFTNR